jgi:small-conductance mechanosensitive channel
MSHLRVLLSVLLLILLAVPPARAASAANPLAALTGTKPASTKPPAAPVTLSAAELNAAVTTLQNPQQRNALIATLQAMSKSATAKAAAAATKAAQKGLGERLVDDASARASFVITDAAATLKSATDLTLVWNWVLFLASDSYLRKGLVQTLTRLALTLGTALAAEYLVIAALARMRAVLVRRAALIRARNPGDMGLDPESEDAGLANAEAGATEQLPRRRVSFRSYLLRVCYGIAHLFLSILPLAAFAAIGFIWLSRPITSARVTHLVIIAVLNAYLLCRLTLEAARFLFAPGAPPLRLIGMRDHRARWLLRWLRRIVAVIAFGYAGVTTGGLFGLYPAARMVLLRLIVLVVHIMLAIVVIQARRPVAMVIRGRPGASGFIPSLRRGLAGIWHIIALFYILALWIAWVLGIPNAFSSLLRIIVVFIGGVVLARSLEFAIGHALDSIFAEDAGWKAGHPTLYSRGRSYMPVVRLTIGVVVGIIAVLVILQGWGIGILAWLFGTNIGQRILTAVLTIAITAVVAFMCWEAVNAALDRRVSGLIARGRTARAVRLNTLLPMLRSTVLVIILVVAGLVMLSAIGVNVTLLLGGLSIFGLAIGFGSQKLVQDVINGLFLLLEDAMQVGDWITVGGISGSVEKLSIRNIRLRGGDGSLNIVPFSSVTTVINTSRDFSYAPINIGVGYKEDVDHVQAVLREIFAGMKAEPEWAVRISGDFELWGLDQFGASALMITGRIKTPAGKQYDVKREFNRRMKMRFDAEGIELPYNYQKIVIDPEEFREALKPILPAAPLLAAPSPAAHGEPPEPSPRLADPGAANG